MESYRINKIAFKNYKIFKDRQELELKPITVIIGKNNSGKSAVAKLPVLIEGALHSDSQEALDTNYGDVILGSELRDLVYGKANRVIEFDIESEENKLSVGILITAENNKQTSLIDYWQCNNRALLQYSGSNKIYLDSNSTNVVNCEFNGIKLKKFTSVGRMLDLKGADDNLGLLTDFIGPIRSQPLRDYRYAPSLTSKSGVLGEDTYLDLIEDALTTDKKLITKVAEWYRNNFEGWEIKINQDKAPIFQIEVHKEELKQNILDTGIGMSQVLPIVTRAFKPCDEETLIIIEEPETHLHPAAHGNLAELFVDSLAQGNKRYLVETHSLNFVLRLRRLVAEKKLNQDDIALYYVDFSQETNSSSLTNLNIDEFGKVYDWPDGIFNETLNETIAIRTAQLENIPNANRD